jgi:drug/metabolite transporter (DMT)-like permease
MEAPPTTDGQPGAVAALLALLSAVVYGAGDFAGGLASRRLPPVAVVWRTAMVGLAGLVLLSVVVPADEVRRGDLAVGALGGLVGGVGILLLYRALAAGTMSVVAPTTAVLAALVPVAVGVATGERPGALALAGIPLALVAIVLLARDPDAEGPAERMQPKVLLEALVAGASFGIFFVCLDAAGDDAGMWPLVAGRTASVALFTLAVALVAANRIGRDGRREAGPGTTRLLVACGAADAGANALFLLATHRGLLSLVAVLGSLYPASTVLLATTLTHERLARSQVVGVVLALAAAAAITAA